MLTVREAPDNVLPSHRNLTITGAGTPLSPGTILNLHCIVRVPRREGGRIEGLCTEWHYQAPLKGLYHPGSKSFVVYLGPRFL